MIYYTEKTCYCREFTLHQVLIFTFAANGLILQSIPHIDCATAAYFRVSFFLTVLILHDIFI